MYFLNKYDYLCKHPYIPAVVHTDHKPITHFLSSYLHEEIYGHWADQLRRLNITIKYIPGHRNKVADGLSRTLFQDDDCSEDAKVLRMQSEVTERGHRWVWKDGKDGFEAFLANLSSLEREEVIQHSTLHGVASFAIESLGANEKAGISTEWKEAYENSVWFGEIYKLLTKAPGYPTDPQAFPKLFRKAMDYRVIDGVLWIHWREDYLPCVPESRVLSVLKEYHDNSGHWAKAGTLSRVCHFYWPGQAQDVGRYVAGCIECARHGPATKSQPLHPIHVTFPFQLMGMDFIGPLEPTKSGARYILNVVCYFSRFVIPFATEDDNVERVLWSLRLVFAMYRKPYAFYCDRGHHFFNDVLKDFLKLEGVNITYSPSGASKSTGMVEVSNRLVEDVLRKHPQNSHLDWDQRLPKSARAVNGRVIPHLGTSPTAILFGQIKEVSATTSTLLALPGRDVEEWVSELEDKKQHVYMVSQYIRYRAEKHDSVVTLSRLQKEADAARYDRGITRTIHHIDDLVMVYQKNTGKLQPRWRGPFKISGYGGSHGVSFTLKQLNGRGIKGTFHGDHLKLFRARTDYSADTASIPLPDQQTIRPPRYNTTTT